MGNNTDSPRAFIISLILHLGFFGVLAVAFLIDWIRPQETEQHVFTLISPMEAVEPVDSAQPQAAPPVPPPPEVEPDLAIPDIAPMRPVPSPRVMEAPRPPPPPAPAPTPTPTPVAEPEPPRRVSREAFIREYGQPRETAPRPAARPAITAPTIDISHVREELQRINQRSGASAPVSEDELMRWRNAVYRLLNRTWEEPREISGRELSAVVQFDVAPDGAVSRVRFVRSSGNEIFDRSISQALARVGHVDSPPGGRGFSPTMTFQRLTE